MTRKILEEIKFYEHFRPFYLIKSGTFGNGGGVEDEHLIPITIDIASKNFFYRDTFDWDITNEENM